MRHILVVEDDPTIRRLIYDVLSDEGFAVSLAASLSEAREALAGPTPHLVTLDLLPGLEPASFCGALRARHGPVPVLIVSGATHIHTVAQELGASFLSKPFDLDHFVAVVHGLTKDVPTPLACAS